MNFSINILKLSFTTTITLFQLVLKNININTLMYKINHILKLFYWYIHLPLSGNINKNMFQVRLLSMLITCIFRLILLLLQELYCSII